MKIVSKTKLKKDIFRKNQNLINQLQNEIAIMKKTFHPNIVRLYEIIDDKKSNELYIVMEYIMGGHLLEKIKKHGKIHPDNCWHYFRELIAGLEYCHEVSHIIHRDIKPENILIQDDDSVRIVDFGVSFITENGNDESRELIGSAFFLAPEICKGLIYKGRQTDIWAAGVTLFYMITGQLPFISETKASLYEAIINKR